MKKELTIEHLSVYLPHKVEVKINGMIKELVCNTIADSHLNQGLYIGILNLLGVHGVNGRLLLRPLSQLTETIEHNGDRFVPIERLAKFAGYEKATWSYWAGPKGSSAGMHYSLEFDTDKGFYIDVSDNYYSRDHSFSFEEPCNNQMLLLRTLHSLHFDTLGLIESGLAEPIPSIPQQ